MSPTTLTLLALTILFIATLTRSTFGFGDALVAMPLLSLVAGVKLATPLVGLVTTVIALVIIGQSWRHIDLKAAWRLVLASFVGVPVGLYLLINAPETVVKGLLGSLIILFGLYNLILPRLPYLRQGHWAFGFGFVAGVLAGAYNTGGPPVVIYGTLRRWTPARFRATLQGYFLPSSTLVLAMHGLSGLWTRQVIWLFILALPAIFIAIYLGSQLNARIPAERFTKLLYIALILLGVLLLIR